jgi:hypothetical protein
MNLEFHYYAILFLASRAGFPEAEARTLAASSQNVDDAIMAWEARGPAGPWRGMVTQNYLFWDEDISDSVYLPFHFLPGDPAHAASQRRDGARNPYIVTPDSPLAKAVLIAALESRNLYRIGIALHSYADTWAHQNFTGRMEEANAIDLSSRLPPAGHLHALRSPDEALGLWRDDRLVPGLEFIDNRERFLLAAKKIYRYLRTFRRGSFADEELVLSELGTIWKRDGRDMEARIADFCIALDAEPYRRGAWAAEAGMAGQDPEDGRASGYDKLQWLKAELKRRTGAGDGILRFDSPRFEGSDLQRWDEAAREHLAAARRLIREAGLAGKRRDA